MSCLGGERETSVVWRVPSSPAIPWVPALLQASGSESRDPWPPRRAHQGASGAGADSEWAHQGAETQVSSGRSMARPATCWACCFLRNALLRTGPLPTSLQLSSWHLVCLLFIPEKVTFCLWVPSVNWMTFPGDRQVPSTLSSWSF